MARRIDSTWAALAWRSGMIISWGSWVVRHDQQGAKPDESGRQEMVRSIGSWSGPEDWLVYGSGSPWSSRSALVSSVGPFVAALGHAGTQAPGEEVPDAGDEADLMV